MSDYRMKKADVSEFNLWWDEGHCVEDFVDRDSGEYTWAREAFQYAIGYALGEIAPACDRQVRENLEATIRGLTSQAGILQESAEATEIALESSENEVSELIKRAEAAEELAARRGEVLMQLRKQVSSDTSDQGLELAKLRNQMTSLTLALSAAVEVLTGEFL